MHLHFLAVPNAGSTVSLDVGQRERRSDAVLFVVRIDVNHPMRNRLARALIVSFDCSVERVLERRFWASPSVGPMATVTELRPSSSPRVNAGGEASATAE